LINIGFGAVESDLFFELKEFGLKLVFFVFLFFEFGLKFLGQKFEGLVLLLKHNRLAVNVFDKNLLVIKNFKFLKLILEFDKFRVFFMQFVLGLFT
jgi:hypothetical protein